MDNMQVSVKKEDPKEDFSHEVDWVDYNLMHGHTWVTEKSIVSNNACLLAKYYLSGCLKNIKKEETDICEVRHEKENDEPSRQEFASIKTLTHRMIENHPSNIGKLVSYHLINKKPGDNPLNGNNPYTCEMCDKVFSNKVNLRCKIHPFRKKYKCGVCNKMFTSAAHLIIHKRTHGDQLPYKCVFCCKSFKQSNGLEKHLKIHTGKKDYKCEVCSVGFTQSAHLKLHMFSHTSQKYYKCDICDKVFTLSAQLKQHLMIHAGKKSYCCEVCNKTFTRKGNLKKHTLIHFGQKNYICDVCGKAFTYHANLKQHFSIHTGENNIIGKYLTKLLH